METKIKKENFDTIFGKMLGGWNRVSNHQWAPLGRVCICWDPEFCNVKELASSDQFIQCEIQLLDVNKSVFVCFVYADNRYMGRRQLWRDMCNISGSISSVPWLVVGDFNANRYIHEKVGGGILGGLPLKRNSIELLLRLS